MHSKLSMAAIFVAMGAGAAQERSSRSGMRPMFARPWHDPEKVEAAEAKRAFRQMRNLRNVAAGGYHPWAV